MPNQQHNTLPISQKKLYPFSDSTDTGQWVLNKEVSDEFNSKHLDSAKWFVQGMNGTYRFWKGQAPAQFASDNAVVENGILKIKTQWQPNFDFSNETFGGKKYENVTTAAIGSKKSFLYGYIEIKSKAGNASVTNIFKAMGLQQELNIFEHTAAPKLSTSVRDNHHTFSFYKWTDDKISEKSKVFSYAHELEYRVADDFHIYGCEWGRGFLKFYVDGQLVYETTEEESEGAWLFNTPLELWLLSETFPSLGLPVASELPVDFQVEYIRVWQRKKDMV